MRARAPLEDTDRPFVLCLVACGVIALMPPPAVALVGPLCQSVDLWEAADRVVRASPKGAHELSRLRMHLELRRHPRH